MILGPDGQKMSKSRGNVVNPDEQVAKYGADAVRCYLMVIGPWSEGGPYNMQGIDGVNRWLNRVWRLCTEPGERAAAPPGALRDLRRLMHKTIKRVGDDVDGMRFNTAIAALMEYANGLSRAAAAGIDDSSWFEATGALLLMVAPLAPHLAEELWSRQGRAYSIHQQSWPAYDAALAADEQLTIAIQVNGKVRDRLLVGAEASEAEVISQAEASEKVAPLLAGRRIVKRIYVPGRLLNIVVG
jgi:leucyl-tRNA synthetase